MAQHPQKIISTSIGFDDEKREPQKCVNAIAINNTENKHIRRTRKRKHQPLKCQSYFSSFVSPSHNLYIRVSAFKEKKNNFRKKDTHTLSIEGFEAIHSIEDSAKERNWIRFSCSIFSGKIRMNFLQANIDREREIEIFSRDSRLNWYGFNKFLHPFEISIAIKIHEWFFHCWNQSIDNCSLSETMLNKETAQNKVEDGYCLEYFHFNNRFALTCFFGEIRSKGDWNFNMHFYSRRENTQLSTKTNVKC